jgi:hypothetical protein
MENNVNEKERTSYYKHLKQTMKNNTPKYIEGLKLLFIVFFPLIIYFTILILLIIYDPFWLEYEFSNPIIFMIATIILLFLLVIPELLWIDYLVFRDDRKEGKI